MRAEEPTRDVGKERKNSEAKGPKEKLLSKVSTRLCHKEDAERFITFRERVKGRHCVAFEKWEVRGH